ncbi:MAG: acetylxylan esterase [Armatimonadota bacterium]|nr:MAG: acetylxylan esterase [Armatimonadota bacterium]
MGLNTIGAYGGFAAKLLGEGPAELSYRNPKFDDLEAWRAEAKAKALELIAQPDTGGTPETEVAGRAVVDGVEVERLRWPLPYGPPTEAVFLKPDGAKGPLPGVLALHDHGGLKYFGWPKIADDGGPVHPMMQAHREECYQSKAWANELAKRGYAVLCHDTFAFGSRRVLVSDVIEEIRWQGAGDVGEQELETEIKAYNQWAAQHESVMAKSLFCAGTTWPAIYLADDQRALDVLCAREEVDSQRVGCCGLSGGGMRTVYLGGLDDRIRCAVCVGLMTTWRDCVLSKSWTHTWMMYTPLLPKYLDWPEILGLRVPAPTMVLNDAEDDLFTLPEMQRADDILREVYQKAHAPDQYLCNFHPGPHKFDLKMQGEAFDWFDRSLNS